VSPNLRSHCHLAADRARLTSASEWALAASIALSASGCVPFIEATTSMAMTLDGGKLGVGPRSTVGVGVQPKEGLGPVVRAEAGGGYDSIAGTSWATRLGGGYTFAFDARERARLELAGDLGTRINGGLFARDLSLGGRAMFVIPFSTPRRISDANESFVFIGRRVEGLVGLRYGHMFSFDGGGQEELSLGLTLRVRAWSDIF
jgi:hypothetical protein